MKSLVLFMFSIVLVTAIMAPSIITLVNSGENTAITMDFNEEENKEEKKEVNEKDFFLDADLRLLIQSQREHTSISSFYIESEYSTSIAIFLPPPEHTV